MPYSVYFPLIYNFLGCYILLINIMKFYLELLYLILVKGRKPLWLINTTEDKILVCPSDLLSRYQHSILSH